MVRAAAAVAAPVPPAALGSQQLPGSSSERSWLAWHAQRRTGSRGTSRTARHSCQTATRCTCSRRRRSCGPCATAQAACSCSTSRPPGALRLTAAVPPSQAHAGAPGSTHRSWLGVGTQRWRRAHLPAPCRPPFPNGSSTLVLCGPVPPAAGAMWRRTPCLTTACLSCPWRSGRSRRGWRCARCTSCERTRRLPPWPRPGRCA